MCFVFVLDEAGEEDSDEDMITDYLMMADPRVEAANKEASSRSGPSPLVPIISVTPHSPAGKHYPILGKSPNYSSSDSSSYSITASLPFGLTIDTDRQNCRLRRQRQNRGTPSVEAVDCDGQRR